MTDNEGKLVGTQFERLCYLASLGFNVPNGMFTTEKFGEIYYFFEKDSVRLRQMHNSKFICEKTILFDDLWENVQK